MTFATQSRSMPRPVRRKLRSWTARASRTINTPSIPHDTVTIPARIFKASMQVSKMIGTKNTTRSEEHTSELQSPCNLVCRLLLEKKKTLHKRRVRLSQELDAVIHLLKEANHLVVRQNRTPTIFAIRVTNVSTIQITYICLTWLSL